MELRDYLHTIQRGLGLIVASTLLLVVVVSVVIYTSTTKFDSNVTLTIDRPNVIDQKSVGYYLYDDYYAIQSSGFLADTVINLLQSPSVVQAIYGRAAVPLPTVRNVSALSKIFTARKFPPATVSITIRTDNEAHNRQLLEAATAELQERAHDLSQNQATAISLHATTTASVVVKPFWSLDIVISTLIGLLLGTFIVFIREYIRPSSHPH